MQHADRVIGLMVDAVQETFVVDADLLQEPPSLDSEAAERFVDAIIPLDGGRMLSRLVVSALLPREDRLAA